MITEKSFVVQGMVEKVLPIEKTANGADVGKFYVKTVTKDRSGNPNTSHFEIRCINESAIKYVYQRARQNTMVKVSGTLFSHASTSADGRRWLNYSLIADRMMVDEDSIVESEKPQETPAQASPEDTYGITGDDLPF